jgi:methionine-rich copper-binding protein CopC
MRPTWIILAASLLGATPASAHAILIDSTPAPLGHVPAGALAVTLRYNSRIDAGRSKLLLIHNDTSTRLQIDPAGADTMHTSLNLTAGDYTIKWQVLATDGHITRGNVPFTVDAPAPTPATH